MDILREIYRLIWMKHLGKIGVYVDININIRRIVVTTLLPLIRIAAFRLFTVFAVMALRTILFLLTLIFIPKTLLKLLIA